MMPDWMAHELGVAPLVNAAPRTTRLRPRKLTPRELAEEIAWLRTFRMSDQRIAQRLNVTVACIERRKYGRAA
jgi:hypothetical protein